MVKSCWNTLCIVLTLQLVTIFTDAAGIHTMSLAHYLLITIGRYIDSREHDSWLTAVPSDACAAVRTSRHWPMRCSVAAAAVAVHTTQTHTHTLTLQYTQWYASVQCCQCGLVLDLHARWCETRVFSV